MAIFPYTTGSHCRQVTIFLENVRFRNMRIMTLISVVSWLPMASSTSPFTYGAVEVIFGSIYFYFHLQTAPDLQDCPHSTNLPTIPESTLYIDLKITSLWYLKAMLETSCIYLCGFEVFGIGSTFMSLKSVTWDPPDPWHPPPLLLQLSRVLIQGVFFSLDSVKGL